ncbi:MAG: patatin-like phospholipase family protein [Bacillota bacterium]
MRGLVLEGGGAKGSYHLGAYKALMEMDIEISGITGTSIGAINGAMIAQGDYEKAKELWMAIDPEDVFKMSTEDLSDLLNFNLDKSNFSRIFGRLKQIFDNKGIDLDNVRKYLDTYVDEEKVRNSQLDFGLVTYSLTDFEPLELFIEDIPEGKLVEYLLASSYLPAFKREKIDGKSFIDGAFHDNLPINMLVQKGYNEIIAIRTYSSGRIQPVEDDVSVSVQHIGPKEDLGRVLEFVPERIKHNIRLGYLDTMRHYQNLKGSNYYIRAEDDEDYYFLLWQTINNKSILEAGRLIGCKDYPAKRLLFEKIIPRLQGLLELDETVGYRELLIASLEVLAAKLEIEPYQIYDFTEFIKKIEGKYQSELELDFREIPDFLKQNELLSRAVRDDLALELISILFEGFFQHEQRLELANLDNLKEEKDDN